MSYFLCDFLNEIVVLSNGSVTTCCVDELGMNTYANIYEDSYDEVVKKHIEIRIKVTRDLKEMPRCAVCYDFFKKQFAEKGVFTVNMNFNATDEDFEVYKKQVTEKCQGFVIELTSKCTLKCIGCVQSRVDLAKHRNQAFIDIDRLESWIGPNLSRIQYIRLYNYGETFIHPHAVKFCSFVKKKSMNTPISVATNGMTLNTHEKRRELILSGVDSLSFSIHGSSQETVQKYMTGKFSFHRIMETLEDLSAIRRQYGRHTPQLMWKYLLFEWNDSDRHIERAKKLAQKIGIDVVEFTLPLGPSPSRRFTANNKNWQELTQDMTLQNSGTAYWYCNAPKTCGEQSSS